MQAIIMAGGKGARLRPYTAVLPKPLMPIGELPILEVVIRQLRKYGFNRIILTVGHQAELFRAFFGTGEKWGLSIEYFVEDKPLGTTGALKYIDGLEDHFLLMNGDILTDIKYSVLMDEHKASGSKMTIAVHDRTQNIDYGVIEYDDDHILTLFREKPSFQYHVSMGIYMICRDIVSLMPQNEYFDFPDLVWMLLDKKVKIHCYPYDGYWMDIGRAEDYEMAIDDFDRMKEILL
jgi:NDP-sugar pyrophosphorylase family protein